MQIAVVFTTCSCRLADIRQELQLNGARLSGLCKIDNRPADFVVLVGHVSLLFRIESLKRFGFLCLLKLLANAFVVALFVFVLTTIAEKRYFPIIGHLVPCIESGIISFLVSSFSSPILFQLFFKDTSDLSYSTTLKKNSTSK